MTDPTAAPVSSHPTHRKLAIRAVDVRAGRVPGINPVPVSERHPDSEAPAHYAEAIDEVTQLNWMDMPSVTFLPGTSPRYELAQPLSPATWGELKAVHKLGYRAGEWYYIPSHSVVLPPVWDPSADAPTPEATKPTPDKAPAASEMTPGEVVVEAVRQQIAQIAREESRTIARQVLAEELRALANLLTPERPA